MTEERTRPFDRRTFLVTGASVAATGLAGCQSSDAEESTGKIGILAPSPDNNPVGQGMVNAANLARDAINDDGGITRTSRSSSAIEGTAQAGRDAYRELTMEENVDFTTGVFNAEVLLGLMDEFADQQTPQVTTGVLTPEVPDGLRDDDYIRNVYLGG